MLEKALQEEKTRNIEDPEQNPAAEPNSTAEDNNDGDDESDEPDPKVHDVRLIDFAHAQWTPGQGPDENVLIGVRSVLKILNELAEQNADGVLDLL